MEWSPGKGCGPHQVLKEARKGPSPPVSRESTAPAERSVWASDADWIHACCVSRQVWGNLSQQPQGSNAGAFFQSMNYEVSGETDLEREGEEESLPASSHLWLVNRFPEGTLGACVLSHFSHVWLFVTPRTVARRAPLSIGFSRQEY